MNTIDKKGDYLYKELTYKIRGAFYEIYNTLGPGFKEIVYQKAFAKELKIRGLNFEQEKSIPIIYKEEKIGIYKPDFVVENKIIIEIKSVAHLTKIDEIQLYYYLKGTNFQLGFLVNFGEEKLKIIRRIYQSARIKNANIRR